MNPKTKFGKIFLAVFVLGMGLMLCPRNAAAFSLNSADIDQIVHSDTNYQINSLFMELNLKKEYVIVGEIQIYFMDFKSGGKHYQTTFVDMEGETSNAASVMASKFVGKRVLVKGYRLANGKIVAKSIQRVELRRK
jgi:hypothetical protein